MSGYSHLTAEERDRLADLMADGLSLRSIARALGSVTGAIQGRSGRLAAASLMRVTVLAADPLIRKRNADPLLPFLT
jgi:hypothetical protein